MKKINNIVVALFVAISLLFVSCSRDELVEESQSLDEGSLMLSYSLAQTRADDFTEVLLENSVLKVYKSNGDLIRRYSPASEAPAELYLVAGDYSVSLSAGVINYATTQTSECVYYGADSFTIEPNKVSSVALNCPMINSAVKIIYDSTVEGNFQDGYVTYVSARDSFSKDEAESDDTYSIAFTESGIGYFILPEEVSNLSWGFYGTHLDSEVGDLSATGVIESPAEATIYTLTLKYSNTPDGYLDITIGVDESADEYDDDYVFSPQPTINSLDYPSSVTQNYSGDSYTYEISAMNDMKSVLVQALDNNGEVLVELAPFVDGATVDLSAQGALYTVINETDGTLTLSSTLFDNFTTAGVKSVRIYAVDSRASKGELISTFRFAGLLVDPTVDLWSNNGVLKACVASDDSHDVVISYRKSGATSWVDGDATLNEDGVYEAEFEPVWLESKSAGGDAIYSLTSGFTAGNTYEYKYSVDGVEQSQSSFATEGVQYIPYADMESSSLTCWESSNSSSSSWASGNNTFASKLCTQGTYSGMGGSSCAVLAGASVSLVDIAAGNLFLGQFERPSISSGKVSFGQSFEWESRPTSFKFKYAASLGTVDAKYHSGAPLSEGDTDIARVFFAIVDWGSRHEVTSGTNAPTGVWDPESQTSVSTGNNIIGYASQYITKSTSGDMIESEITVYYYDTVNKPSKNISIVISCATSAYGDYMTGSTSSKLYVDDFELCY